MTRIFFDTNVCGRIAASDRRRQIIHQLRDKYVIAVSANTLLELLLGLCRSTSNQRFADHQERFRVALGSTTVGTVLAHTLDTAMKGTTFLDYPLNFAFLHGANVRTAGDGVGERVYREYTEVVLAASDLQELKTGVPWPPNPLRLPLPVKETKFLKCHAVENDLLKGKHYYSAPLNDAKAHDLHLADSLTWARNLGKFYGVHFSDDQATALTDALDAVYQYQRTVWHMSRKGTFRPEKNERDWIDMNQLFYLSDPALEFVTGDTKIRKRCEQSDQAVRIIALQELLDREGLSL